MTVELEPAISGKPFSDAFWPPECISEQSPGLTAGGAPGLLVPQSLLLQLRSKIHVSSAIAEAIKNI